jgi:hypothetical protein
MVVGIGIGITLIVVGVISLLGPLRVEGRHRTLP